MSSTTATWKIMLSESHTDNFILRRFKISPYSTEWIEACYKCVCGNILMVWSCLFMIRTHHKVTETANPQWQTIKPAYFIIWLSIEYKGIYL